ncbi:ATP-binding protein [Pseudochryseolinea flava]|uniref:Histidine kinase/HSP90-like ATPase domain-containing protein n=1 Tax=Pseudochryseolinea flava TaxID=2059302 RepID=A0A364Y6Z0_9BACT|nr:sensor histidine kinase [Pseudochryseolinea flava]RAW02874.1 hypothetical protein DQQ10_01835 [Pseudochryseolinea flava]
MQQIDQPKKIEIREYLSRIIDVIVATHRNPHLTVSFQLDINPIECSPYTAMNIAQLVKELIENSLRHGYRGRAFAQISITLKEQGSQCSLVVADNGGGMNGNSDPYKDVSSGLHLVSVFVANLKGHVRMIQSHGTRFEIEFPKN